MGETTADATDSAQRATRFSDVCGTVDEIKRLVAEEPVAVASQPQAVGALVEEALAMLRRMEPRLDQYERFRAQVIDLAAALQELGDAPALDAGEAGARLRALVEQGRVLSAEERAAVGTEAEAIRGVAVAREQRLYRFKELALALGRAYREIQGDRSWVLDETEAETEVAGQPPWARWLPPSPHRERLLRYLRAGRAHLRLAEAGQPPMLEFEDGGLMPLPAVRWSEEVRNFYAADRPPHARGLLYREEA